MAYNFKLEEQVISLQVCWSGIPQVLSVKCQCDSLLHNHTESHTCNIPTGVINVSVTVYYIIILSLTHAIYQQE